MNQSPTPRSFTDFWPQWLLAVIFGILWFGAPAYRTLTEPDEGRYAEIPREMLVSGDWVVPHLNGIEYLEKPPLQYWATATAYQAFGITPWSSRLWSVGLGFAGLWVVLAIGRAQFGRAAGRYAACVAASCPLYLFIAQINVLDMGLAFFLTCGLGCFLQSQRRAPQAYWMWLCWLALSLGFLQKGLVALALPGLALLLFSLLQRDFSLWRRLQLLAGLLIVAVVTLPWLLLMEQRSPGFLAFFFVHEHLLRFATNIHQRVEPWWFFIGVLLVGTLPWWPAIVAGLRSAWRTPQAAAGFAVERFLLVWAATILLFFSSSSSKLVPYIVPVVAPLALLAGAALARSDVPFGRWRDLWPVLLLAAICALAPWYLPHNRPEGIVRAAYAAVSQWLLVSGACIAVGALLTALARRGGRSRAFGMTTLAVALGVGLTLIICSTNAIEPVRGGPSDSAAFASYLRANTPLYCIGLYPQTVIFALRRSCILVEYHGELMTELPGGTEHWIPTLDGFAARWSQQADAVAIVDPDAFRKLRARGVALQAIAANQVAVLAVHPQR